MKKQMTTKQMIKKHGYIPGNPPKNLLDSIPPKAENESPLPNGNVAALQFCLDTLYKRLRHEPDFGASYLDGLRQAQKDLDHLVSVAAGDPPAATKKSSMLRQLAASTEFSSVSRELIARAERLERQAEGLRYKFSKERLEKKA